MAKQQTDIIQQFNAIKEKIISGSFDSFYLLMGEEPYYVDKLCNLIIEHALQPYERDFNQTILYGGDTNVQELISLCSRFPMMAERQLVIVKEAQTLKKADELNKYLDHLVDTTVLVLCFTGKSADKRTLFYKNALKKGVVFESQKTPEEAIPRWIETYISSLGKTIDTDAAMLLAEYAGTELRKIVLEIEKLTRSLDDTRTNISAIDIEKNIGISREFNITELTDALATKDAVKAFRIAHYFGESPKKYPLIMTLGSLFFFFSKVEQINALRLSNPAISINDAASQAGIFYKYSAPYIAAAKNYPLKKSMKIISAIRQCDYKSKSNTRGEASEGALLIELISTFLI